MSLGLAVRKKAPSVTFTLALRFSLVLALAVLSLAVLFTFALKRYIYNSQSRELKDSAEELALALKTNAQPEQKEKIPYYITYAVYQKESQEILETNDPFLPLLEVTKGKTKKFVSKNYFIDGDLRILYFAMEEESDEYGSLVIQTALNLDTDSSSLLLRGIPVIVLLAFLPVLFVSFLTALLIAKRSLAPVVKMTEAAKKISSTNLGELLPVKQKDSSAENISTGNLDELDKLAVTFNDLFVRLKKDFDRERGFTSDVSHELKTPLAVILGQANLLRRWGKDDKAQLEKSLGIIVEEAESMNAVITNLLHITRLENKKLLPQKEKFFLADFFARLKEEVQSLSPDAKVSATVSKDLNLFTDREMLHQIFLALISNSIKFCKEKNLELTFSALQKETKTELCIVDNGPGFKAQDLEHVFDRFYRGDESHTRSAGGAGLGLSIAKALAESLGGTITAFNAEAGGAGVRLVLDN